MNRTLKAAAVILILGIAVAGYYYWSPGLPRAPGPAAPAPSVALPPPPAPPAQAQIRYPVESAAPAAPLPALEDSDTALVEALREPLGAKALALLITDRLIHRIVATVDALPCVRLPTGVWPLKPVAGAFRAEGEGGGLALAAGNAARYAPYAALARAVDARRLVDVYRRFYPLFQQAYRELGYPKGYFNDRLIEAIDNLLAAPEPAQPVRLVQPNVLYLFADPDLESRSAGQKTMIRMGPDNEAAVKAKLGEIRQALTGGKAEAR